MSDLKYETFALPVSMAQEAFWYLSRLNPGVTAFNVSFRLRLEGEVDYERVHQALQQVVDRHESLRTTFEETPEGLRQIVHSIKELPWRIHDLTHLSEEESLPRSEELAVEEAQTPFDLHEDTLIRVQAIRLKEKDGILLLTMHHIISDGWSVGVLTREFAEIYASMLEGREPNLPELEIQFADYAIWQKEYLESPEIQEQVDYWKKKLDGLQELDMPTDFVRPAEKSFKGDIISRPIPDAEMDRVYSLAKEHQATIFMLFLAVGKILLHKYTGQKDITIGSPVAGRTRPEVENLIGVFINTVLFRDIIDEEMTFRDFFNQVRDTVLEGLANQDLPFEKLVRELAPDRDAGRNPLLQFNFTHQRSFIEYHEIGEMKLYGFPSRSPGAFFDFQLFTVDWDGAWRVSCDFSFDLFTRETAWQILDRYALTLERVLDNPDMTIADIQLIGSDEEQEALFALGTGPEPALPEEPVHELIGKMFVQHPDKEAVCCDDVKLSYAELGQQSSALAAVLRSKGIGRKKLVGVYCDRSPNMVIALLAILKCGAAYVPMDPIYPAQRIRWMVEDADIDFVLTEAGYEEAVREFGAEPLLIGMHETGKEMAEFEPVDLGDLAYVIFTSGSTGRPKGVEISHRALLNFLHSMQQKPGMNCEDALLAVTTLSFDIAGLELFLPLLCGARLVIASKEMTIDGAALVRAVEDESITLMQATPVTWKLMIDSGWTSSPDLKILCGGEAFPRDLANTLVEKGQSVWNMYGPTETTVWSTCDQVEAGDGAVSIGLPIANTTVYIVDKQMKPVARGIPGELVIGGMGLAEGYLGNPDLTAEKFVTFPATGERVYRTGDLARILHDGRFDCLGRVDHQVKLRGYRIELGEIEEAMRQHESVHDAAVLLYEKDQNPRLVAYYVPTGGVDEDIGSGLQEWLSDRLPHYMVPSNYTALETFPLTPNGKLDRKSFPEPMISESVAGAEVPPDTETEKALVKIWEDLLQCRIASVSLGFFDAGGHSLLALRLFSAIEKQFGVVLPLATLFRAPTIRELAVKVDGGGDSGLTANKSTLVELTNQKADQNLFLIHAGEGGTLFYKDFAEELKGTCAVFGVEAPWMTSDDTSASSLEEVAAEYIELIRNEQPHGPYMLAGYCYGGGVAYEMAAQLRAVGEEVKKLILFDTSNPLDMPKRFGVLKRMRVNMELVGGMSLGEKVAFLHSRGMGKLSASLNRMKERMLYLRESVSGRSGAKSTVDGLVVHARRHHEGLFFNYVPKPYEGEMILIEGLEREPMYDYPVNLGWSPVIKGEIRDYKVPASHLTMLQYPSAIEVAGIVSKEINGEEAG